MFKNYRPYLPPNEKIDCILDHANEIASEHYPEDPGPYLKEIYGELADEILIYMEFEAMTDKSFECKDCINLDTFEYFERRAQALERAAAEGKLICF